jgi:hypothetical protein
MYPTGLASRVLLLLLTASSYANADFDHLLSRVPSDANLLMMVDAEAVLTSQLATAENWGKAYATRFGSAPLMLPPSAKQFVMGARLDLATMTPEWEAAATQLKTDVPMSAVARLAQGAEEEIGGIPAVASHRGDYVLKFGDGEFGMMRPADRQRTAQWIREALSATEPNLSAYLAKAAAYPKESGTDIVLAIDLTDAMGLDAIRTAAAASPVLSKSGVDPEAAAKVLAGLEGLTLGVKVSDRAHGSLRVDFASDIEPISKVAKDLLLEALEEAGMMIDEFGSWKLQTTRNSFRISGEFTTSGLRRVFDLLELDASAIGESGETAGKGVVTEGKTIDPYVTLQYYKGITSYLHDLKMETGAKSYYTIARWFERYADRIDRLPILGVDPELLNYSQQTVGLLRDCGSSIRTGGIRAGGRSAGVQGSSNASYYTGNNSVFSSSLYSTYQVGQDAIRDADSQRRAIRGQEKAQSSTEVREIVRNIQEETSRIRRVMTEKHGIEF